MYVAHVLPDISGKPEVSGITQYFGYSQMPISGATYISDVVFHWSNQQCYIHLWCRFFQRCYIHLWCRFFQRCYIHLWCRFSLVQSAVLHTSLMSFFPAVLHTSLMSLFSAVLHASLMSFFIGPSLFPIEYIFPHYIIHILYYRKCRYHHKNIHFSVVHGPKEFSVAFDQVLHL